jgi:hypothetical protein
VELKIEYGCECTECRVHNEQGFSTKNAPILRVIHRRGSDMKICSRCLLRSDKLLQPMVDEDTDLKPFFDYDPLISATDEFKHHKDIREMTMRKWDDVRKEMDNVMKDLNKDE